MSIKLLSLLIQSYILCCRYCILTLAHPEDLLAHFNSWNVLCLSSREGNQRLQLGTPWDFSRSHFDHKSTSWLAIVLIAMMISIWVSYEGLKWCGRFVDKLVVNCTFQIAKDRLCSLPVSQTRIAVQSGKVWQLKPALWWWPNAAVNHRVREVCYLLLERPCYVFVWLYKALSQLTLFGSWLVRLVYPCRGRKNRP